MDFIISNNAAWYKCVYRRLWAWQYKTRKAIERKLKMLFYAPHCGKKPLTR